MKILFLHNDLRTFVRADLEILQSEHDVRVIDFGNKKQYLQEVIQGIEWCDLVFGWWATWHILLPTILAKKQNKPVIIVGGDYDIIFRDKNKSIGRMLRDRFRKILGQYLFPRIDCFIVNSDFSKAQALKLSYINPDQVLRIYHGFPDFSANKPIKKINQILTVGTVSRYELFRKGLATFVKSAEFLPEHRFKLVGPWKDDAVDQLKSWNQDNVVYTGFLSENELFQSMGESKVYVQVSHHEGFGMALAEAMLFECIPVVTDLGAIPEVVGDCGIYVPYGDPQKTADGIREAIARRNELGPKARERVLTLFPIENRKKQLLSVIDSEFLKKRLN